MPQSEKISLILSGISHRLNDNATMKKTKKHPFVAALLNGEYNGISRLVEPEDRQSAQKYRIGCRKTAKKQTLRYGLNLKKSKKYLLVCW